MPDESATTGIDNQDNETELDEGKSGREFPLWAAQQALASAEDCLDEIEASRASLAKNATSYIGWSVSLSAALIAVAGKADMEAAFRVAATGACICTLGASLCAFKAVSVKGWQTAALHPDLWIAVIDADPPLTEMDVIRDRLRSLSKAINENSRLTKSISRSIQHSGFLLASMPFVGSALVLVVKMALYLSS
ncbi:hypothetical protein ACU81Q_10245 [Komagataeibacter melomenusus]